jgi:hypothetical protein
LYATVLDDDGNIMKGRTIQVTLNDTTFDHFQKAVWTRHSDMVGNNTYFTSTKNLNDTGTFGDAVSNDGLYTTTIAMPASLLTDVATSPRMDDQIRVKIDVKDTASGLTATTYVLISWGNSVILYQILQKPQKVCRNTIGTLHRVIVLPHMV